MEDQPQPDTWALLANVVLQTASVCAGGRGRGAPASRSGRVDHGPCRPFEAAAFFAAASACFFCFIWGPMFLSMSWVFSVYSLETSTCLTAVPESQPVIAQ